MAKDIKDIYAGTGMTDTQLEILECILGYKAPDLLDELSNGRKMTLADIKGNLFEDIMDHYKNVDRDILELLANFRQPNRTSAMGPGEMLMVMFVDGARFALPSEESDVVVGDLHIEMKGNACRICGQKTDFDSVEAYNYTKWFATTHYGITLTDDKPNGSIRGMCQFLEKALENDPAQLKQYLYHLAKIIDPDLPGLEREVWAEQTLDTLQSTPRTVVISDPRMVGRGKNRHYDPYHTVTRKIVASKSIGPAFIQAQGELCFNRYARDEQFGSIMTFNKNTGACRLVEISEVNIGNVHEICGPVFRFTRGIGTGHQDNGPQADIL